MCCEVLLRLSKDLLDDFVIVTLLKVQAYCKTKGIDFQLIDLSDSFIDNSYMFDPNLVNVRLSELEHCMKYSFAVSSVFLVGEKYGFTPLPRIVDKSEFEILLQYMENYEDKQLAFMVYELDYNSQPVTYIYEEEYVHTVFKEITAFHCSLHSSPIFKFKTGILP